MEETGDSETCEASFLTPGVPGLIAWEQTVTLYLPVTLQICYHSLFFIILGGNVGSDTNPQNVLSH